MVALTAPFVQSSVSIIANLWFTDKERNSATTIATLFQPLGSLLSMTLTGLVAIQLPESTDPTFLTSVQDVTFQMFLIQNGIITVLLLFFLITVRKEPEIPPSFVSFQSSQLSNAENKEPLCTKIKRLLANRSFVGIMVAFGMVFGVFTANGNCLSQMFEWVGMSATMISMFGTFFIVVGVICSIIMGRVLDRTQKYLLVFRVFCLLALISSALSPPTMYTKNIPVMFANDLFMGMSFIPVIPIGFSFAAEVTYPESPEIVNGMMLSLGNATAVILTFTANP